MTSFFQTKKPDVKGRGMHIFHRVHALCLLPITIIVLTLGYSCEALAWKHGGHHVVASRVTDGLANTGYVKVFKDAMLAHPDIVAFASNGPDFGFYNIPGVFYGDFPWADRMHYDRVGSFTKRLTQLALESGDSQLIAFAGAYITHVAGDIYGHSLYVNTFSDGKVYLGSPDSVKEHHIREVYSDSYIFDEYYKNKNPVRIYSPADVHAVFSTPADFDETFTKLNSFYRQAVYDVFHIEPHEVPDLKDWFNTLKVIIDAQYNGIEEVGTGASDFAGRDLMNIYDSKPMKQWIVDDPTVLTRLTDALEQSTIHGIQFITEVAEYKNPSPATDPFRSLTDFLNLDAGIDDRSIGSLVLNIDTKDDWLAGSIDDMYFALKADDGTEWWSSPLKNPDLTMTTIRREFEKGAKSTFYLYVYQNQFNYPLNRIKSVCLKKINAISQIGDDWEPEKLTVRVNGKELFVGTPPMLTTDANTWCSSSPLITLEESYGEALVITAPSAAPIFVDGVPVGTGRWRGMLTVGPHTVSFGEPDPNSGYQKPDDQAINILSNAPLKIISGFYVDTRAPSIEFGPINCLRGVCPTGQLMPNLDIKWKDNGNISRVSLKNLANGQSREFSMPVGTSGTISTTSPVLAYGINRLTAEVYDLAGNMGSAFVTFNYDPLADSTAPDVTISSHTNNQHVTTSSILLTGTVTDGPSANSRGCNGISTLTVNGASDWSSAEGSDSSPCGIIKWEKKVRLQPGANTITAQASDKSGRHNTTEKTITVYSDLSTYYDVNVTKTGAGIGIISSAPLGITCGNTCSYKFPSDETIFLTAVSGTRSYCSGWTGCDYTTDGLCAVKPTQTKNVSIDCAKGDFLLNGGSYYTRSSTFTIDINNIPEIGSPDQIQARLNGIWSNFFDIPATKKYTFTFTPTNPVITINARFKTGNIISRVFTASITHDNIPPSINLSTLPDLAFTADPILNIKGTIIDSSGIKSLLINGKPILARPTGSGTWDFSHALELEPGLNYYRIDVTDLADNHSTLTRSVTFDSTDVVSISSPAEGTVTTQSSINVIANSNKFGGVGVSLNGVSIYSGKLGATMTIPIDGLTPDTTLKEGINTITVAGTLRGGTSESATRTIYRLPAASPGTRPIIEVTSPPQDLRISTRTLNLQGTISTWSTPVSVTIDVDGRSYVLTPADTAHMTFVNGYYTFQQELSLPEDKAYSITVTAAYNGSAGNLEYFTVRRALTVDTVLPFTTVSPQAGTYVTSLQVSLVASKANSTIYYSLDGTDPQATVAYQYTAPFTISAADTLVTRTVKFFSVDQYGAREAVNTRTFNIIPQVLQNGYCGPSHDQIASTSPTAGFCAAGITSAINGSGPWNWSCKGMFGGIDANCSANLGYPLTIIFNDFGSGTVTGTAQGYANSSCNKALSANCAQTSYIVGTTVSLSASPDWKSTFDSWSGVDASDLNTASVAMNRDRIVLASFAPIYKVILQPSSTPYASIQDAYKKSISGGIIQSQEYSFAEGLDFSDNNISEITLIGGMDSLYQSTLGFSVVKNFTIRSGKVNVMNVKVRP